MWEVASQANYLLDLLSPPGRIPLGGFYFMGDATELGNCYGESLDAVKRCRSGMIAIPDKPRKCN